MLIYNYNYVRVEHIPTGINFLSSEQRSQHKNREVAMKIIKARLWASKNVTSEHIFVRDYEIPDDKDYRHLDTYLDQIGK